MGSKTNKLNIAQSPTMLSKRRSRQQKPQKPVQKSRVFVVRVTSVSGKKNAPPVREVLLGVGVPVGELMGVGAALDEGEEKSAARLKSGLRFMADDSDAAMDEASGSVGEEASSVMSAIEAERKVTCLPPLPWTVPSPKSNSK